MCKQTTSHWRVLCEKNLSDNSSRLLRMLLLLQRHDQNVTHVLGKVWLQETHFHDVCGLRGAVVNVVAFKAKGRGFKSTHGFSHTMQKPSISPALFGQCKLNIYLPFTILYHFICKSICFCNFLPLSKIELLLSSSIKNWTVLLVLPLEAVWVTVLANCALSLVP